MRAIFYLFFILFFLKVTAQQTYIPDDNFEQGLIDLGYDSPPLDDYVPTNAIESITSLFLENKSIVDMTGIEDFIGLNLIDLTGNFIEELDLSQNINLERIDLYNNNLNSLNIKNGNLYNILSFNAQLNPNLSCIDVDDVSYANSNLQFIDSQTQFSNNCESLSITSASNMVFSFYPNPVKNQLHIKMLRPLNFSIQIYNTSGQILFSDTSNSTNLTINTSHLVSGIYLIKVNNSVKKLVKV
ncbi:T9SS type A sorting domain-containing protein [Psychroflexus sp. ALD_RP9]|uniref:T9SS type A sorting domain-containing protein n=1 Tax=Psychroflexus sp. ALD_RP9 TaxID=2777186 RepID=UPI001A8D9FB0|nr:T9SS type A sorting domain-containing protein [Psychroflexus sp. ALD_RP9]QSS97330.1 T9SS type A sorting domain-containing protein [Psychroflexus sp. ALD_RP9]